MVSFEVVKPMCSEVRVDSGMRPVMGTDALAYSMCNV